MSVESNEVLLKFVLKLQLRILKIIDPTLKKKKEKSGDKTSPTKKPAGFRFGDWDDPWIVNSENVDNWENLEKCLKVSKNFPAFKARYIPRPRGPTKAVRDVINHLMSYPENHNFYLNCKRCYVHVADNRWEQLHPRKFFPQLRAKILEHYKTLVLRAHPEPAMNAFASEQLKKASLDSWTNGDLEVLFSKYGKASFDRREKTRSSTFPKNVKVV